MDLEMIALLAIAVGVVGLVFVVVYQQWRATEDVREDRAREDARARAFLLYIDAMTKAVQGVASEFRALRVAMGVPAVPLDAPWWWASGERVWPAKVQPPKQARGSTSAAVGSESADYPRTNIEPPVMPAEVDDEALTRTRLSPGTAERTK